MIGTSSTPHHGEEKIDGEDAVKTRPPDVATTVQQRPRAPCLLCSGNGWLRAGEPATHIVVSYRPYITSVAITHGRVLG